MAIPGFNNKDNSEVLYFGLPTSPQIFDFSSTLLSTPWKHVNLNKESEYYEHPEKAWLREVEVDLNSREFRSDEFVVNGIHSGEHILFAGCSNTFGDGLYKEETWPHKVYTEIAKNKTVSGYFNIGFPGISIVQTISWIFKYIKEFGNPNTIFVFLPDTGRFVGVSAKDHNEIFGTVMVRKDDHVGDIGQYLATKRMTEYFAFELYSMLETYCLANGIKLIASSWTKSENEFHTFNTLKEFETFFLMDPDKKEEPRFVYEYIEKYNPETKLVARDGIHMGEPGHAYWALKMLQQYYGDSYENPWN